MGQSQSTGQPNNGNQTQGPATGGRRRISNRRNNNRSRKNNRRSGGGNSLGAPENPNNKDENGPTDPNHILSLQPAQSEGVPVLSNTGNQTQGSASAPENETKNTEQEGGRRRRNNRKSRKNNNQRQRQNKNNRNKRKSRKNNRRN